MQVYFFGCWNDRVGHYLFEPSGKSFAPWDNTRTPWPRIDGALPPGGDDRNRQFEYEGHARLHHKDGWTALAWWDRSVDKRGGCNAALFAQGTHTFDDMIRIGHEHFPTIMARFAYQIREAK